jgi:integrase
MEVAHMARQPKFPRYPKGPHASGQARIVIQGKSYYLGLWGTPESHTEYARLAAEHAAEGVVLPTKGSRDRTVAEMAALYLTHAELVYSRGREEPSDQLRHIRAALRAALSLYGHVPCSDFGPRALRAVRMVLVAAGNGRRYCNWLANLLKAAFRWAASEELIPAGVYQALATVPALRSGETDAAEPTDVLPVEDAIVDATLPHLNATAADLVRLQRLTGMRPGEACRMRAADLDMTGDVWIYRPESHKTRRYGKQRIIYLGPQAQAIVRVRLTLDLQAPLFLAPRTPGQHYRPGNYAKAIEWACKQHSIPPWHPHQLRHAAATRIRETHGLDAASAVLGHSSLTMTTLYAQLPQQKAADAMREIG